MKTKLSVGKKQVKRQAAKGGCAALAFCAAMFPAGNADAVGFRLPNQDPEAIARGNAFVATADNPSAIYYNPAGITQLPGQTASAGLYLISTDVKYEGPNGASAQSRTDFQEVPQFGYVFTPKECPVSFGLGVYVPYGLGMRFSDSSPFKDVAQNGSILYTTINPVIAWAITTNLSIGVGPTINYSKADFNQGFTLPPMLGGFNGQFHFVGDDIDYGFNAGIRYQVCDKLAFGANYRYMTTMNYQGHFSSIAPGLMPNNSSDASASLRFPQFGCVGVSFRPTPKWNLEFDADWTDWDNVNQGVFKGTVFPGTVFASPIPNLTFDYKSSWMYEFGVTRQLPKGYFVSGGYIYSENSSPDASFNPLIPDSNLHLFSVGVGHKGEHWGWAVSYTLAIQPNRTVSGSANNNPSLLASSTSVDGKYSILNNAVNASISVKF